MWIRDSDVEQLVLSGGKLFITTNGNPVFFPTNRGEFNLACREVEELPGMIPPVFEVVPEEMMFAVVIDPQMPVIIRGDKETVWPRYRSSGS